MQPRNRPGILEQFRNEALDLARVRLSARYTLRHIGLIWRVPVLHNSWRAGCSSQPIPSVSATTNYRSPNRKLRHAALTALLHLSVGNFDNDVASPRRQELAKFPLVAPSFSFNVFTANEFVLSSRTRRVPFTWTPTKLHLVSSYSCIQGVIIGQNMWRRFIGFKISILNIKMM